ncbi:hypothetical protein FCI23_31495 [Actinacidiphila oryziradicis]|uniref:Band 7 domain-containing protein n=1 Tax=Actinacidiphila oryziradicis TaxID=2571141 RepID=A0A4U0SCV8_9ACTN|nr:hypothetical protein FCI23_31495 [Actinacidiphila oryziradicis]
MEATFLVTSNTADTVPLAYPVADDLGEHPGRALPGWSAVLAVLAAAAGAGWVLWRAAVLPVAVAGEQLLPEPPDRAGLNGVWGAIALLAALVAFAVGGLCRGRPGVVWVLTRHGAYRGTVRATGLLWISPLLVRRRMDVTLRHWRSSPIEAVDSAGTPVLATVLLVWRVRDTARATFAVHDHTRYLREQVEAAVTRAVSRFPTDDFRDGGPTLRDTDSLANSLTSGLAADLRPIGVELFSAQPVRLSYADEVAAAMQRAQIAALDAQHRRAVLDDVLTAVQETVRGLTDRGMVQLDDYERKALVKDLTVAFYTARGPVTEAPHKDVSRQSA